MRGHFLYLPIIYKKKCQICKIVFAIPYFWERILIVSKHVKVQKVKDGSLIIWDAYLQVHVSHFLPKLIACALVKFMNIFEARVFQKGFSLS